MSPRILFAVSLLGLTILAGCDYDTHPTATGKTIRPQDTNGPTDSGALNAGGPGAQGQTPK